MKRSRRLSIAITSGLLATALLVPAGTQSVVAEHSTASSIQICIDPNNPIWDDGLCIP